MLRFQTFHEDADEWISPLRNAYLIGNDGHPMRGEISVEDGTIVCDKREQGPAALNILYPAGALGELSMQTTLLPERDRPYVLEVELARHRLMTVYLKREDWGMLDLADDHPVPTQTARALEAFLEAVADERDAPESAAEHALVALEAAIDASEELALAHADRLLGRRMQTRSMPTAAIGCTVHPTHTDPRLRPLIAEHFEYIQLPIPWKLLSPEEGAYRWDAIDSWVEWATEQKMPIVAGPLISFDPDELPDWLYIWEHDYDTLRDLAYEHIEEVVGRYVRSVGAWNVVSGLHINTHFSFNFEQLMDLTRMSLMLAGKMVSGARLYVELRQPFGEYYAQNPRSIPPTMFADLVTQSGVAFDGFSLRMPMGRAAEGEFTRDLLQVSSLLDRMQPFGKPVLLTTGVPSEPVTSWMLDAAAGGEPADDRSGSWRKPWGSDVQSLWLQAVYQIALSKPFVDAVAWMELTDHELSSLPMSGLISDEMRPKSSVKRLIGLRKAIRSPRPTRVATELSDIADAGDPADGVAAFADDDDGPTPSWRDDEDSA
ncbi:MAG: endo-1,4-beta-xylanase [Planctomycetota bacterium]